MELGTSILLSTIALCFTILRIVRIRAEALVLATQQYSLKRINQTEGVNFVAMASGPDPREVDKLCQHRRPVDGEDDNGIYRGNE